MNFGNKKKEDVSSDLKEVQNGVLLEYEKVSLSMERTIESENNDGLSTFASKENIRRDFEIRMKDTQRQAFAMAFRLTGNMAEAEDLVQDTFLRAFRFFHRYNYELPFSSWIYRIMSNAHVDAVRKRGKLKTTSFDQNSGDGNSTWDLPATEATPDEALLSSQMNDHIQKALNRLNPDFRAAVIFSDVEGLAYEDIAEIMQTSVGTVRSRIHRGRKLVKNYLLTHAPRQYRSYLDELQ